MGTREHEHQDTGVLCNNTYMYMQMLTPTHTCIFAHTKTSSSKVHRYPGAYAPPPFKGIDVSIGHTVLL